MRVIVLAVAVLVAAPVSADVWVRPYVRSDGTMVQGHWQSAPNGTPYDNYSTRGHINPYTGREGTVQPRPYTPIPAPRPYVPRPMVPAIPMPRLPMPSVPMPRLPMPSVPMPQIQPLYPQPISPHYQGYDPDDADD